MMPLHSGENSNFFNILEESESIQIDKDEIRFDQMTSDEVRWIQMNVD